MDNRRLPLAHRLSRFGLAVAAVATFGTGATVAVVSGWTARMASNGQDVIEWARTMWGGL